MHPGDIIAGKYRVANVLGRGRGLLLEARHTEFDQRVVIRLLSPHMCDEKQLEQFRREARTLSKLESEHVARIIDVGTHSDGSFFFVRQYLDGIDIGTHIRSQGALRLEEAVLYILQAAEAVQETHSHNIVLRELQPSHLFLTRRRGGAPLVKITDFGTAKVLKDPAAQVVDGEMTATVMFGMSQYSSPELVRKAKDIDARTDVWSLGCILYEMLTAMTPFQGEMAELMLKITREEPIPLSNLRPDLPQEIDQIMGWALAKDRNARFSSVYAFAHALKPYASPEGQVLIDQIGRLAHAKNDDQSSGQISPTSPLAKRRGGMPDDEDRTVIRQVPSYPGPAGGGEHDFERTQFMGNGPGSVPAPPGSVPGSQPGRGSVPPPPPRGSHPGSVPPPAMGSHPGSVPPPAMGSQPAAAMPAQRAPQGSWVEADPAAPSGVAAASQPYGAAPKKKNRGLVIALGAALVLLPVAVVAGILAMRSGGDEIAQADTSSDPQGEPAPPLNEGADGSADEQPTATDDGADTTSEGDEPSDAGDEDGGEEDGGDANGDEDGGDEPEPKTAEAPTPTPTPKSLAPQPPTTPKPDTQPVSSTKKKKKKKTTKKKKPPPPPESGGTGTLVAIAIGGSCSFAVDGAPRGTKSSIRIKVPVGRHTVSCTPPKGATRTQSVNVKSGKPGIASFRLN